MIEVLISTIIALLSDQVNLLEILFEMEEEQKALQEALEAQDERIRELEEQIGVLHRAPKQ